VTDSRAWASGGSRRGRLQALLAAAGSFLLDPPEAVDSYAPAGGADPDGLRDMATPDPPLLQAVRPVVAVFGLAGGCGSTMVARALAAELAARDASGTAAVACESRPGGLPLATKAATRLARALQDLPGGARALGRLCLLHGGDPSSLGDALRGLAPLVIDAGSSSLGGVAACIADRTLIVTTPAIEPTLARVAIECVARVGPEPTLVMNRARHADDPSDAHAGYPIGASAGESPTAREAGSRGTRGGRGAREGSGGARGGRAAREAGSPGAAGGDPGESHDGAGERVVLPESRLGAQLALGGREARGGLGRAIVQLVDRWEGGA
jgi:hypothetical protein